jgi:PTH1 family peptidyl-tRNA hydrolase
MQVEFVLGRWNETEIPVVRKKFDKCAEIVESYVFRGLEAAMNEANKLEFAP